MVWFGQDLSSNAGGATPATEATLSSVLSSLSAQLSVIALSNSTLMQVSSSLNMTNITLAQVRDGKAIEAVNKFKTSVIGVANTNTVALVARATRRYALITLVTSTAPVYLSHGTAAVIGQGEALLSEGSVYQIDFKNFSTLAVNLISAAAFTVAIEEFYD